MKILIVDDEPGTRLVVATAVQRLGHTALQAEDGSEGWQAFTLHRPQVVITDWAMPGIDGTELSGRIRAAEAGYTYIMLLTARADENASRAAVRGWWKPSPITASPRSQTTKRQIRWACGDNVCHVA